MTKENLCLSEVHPPKPAPGKAPQAVKGMKLGVGAYSDTVAMIRFGEQHSRQKEQQRPE